MRFHKLLPSLVCGLTLLVTTGCSSLPLERWFGSQEAVASPANPAVDVVCLWEPSEGRDLRGLPRRGMKGQIMFFTHGTNSPVVVNGDVKVYQFDNYGPRESWDKPVHQFEFSAAQWNSFLAQGMLGPTYNVFIPYMRKHPEQVNVTLQLRFTPHDGSRVIYSKTANTALPGVFKQEEAARVADRAALRNDSNLETKQETIARTLGVIPAKPRIDSSAQTEAVSNVPAYQSRNSAGSPTLLKPEITIIDREDEQDDSLATEQTRQQFRLSPLR
ncbi:MAG TPA: hypothetical protein VMM56_10770 [Planctomycetaceae bacterium]|nr:hypothetical protein [Planctomycetaceae bacterium]